MYIFPNGPSLLVIDASTGNTVYNSNFPAGTNVNQSSDDNAIGKLYGSGYTIDEASGKYIFIGTDPPSSACIKNYLYVVALGTGNILLIR